MSEAGGDLLARFHRRAGEEAARRSRAVEAGRWKDKERGEAERSPASESSGEAGSRESSGSPEDRGGRGSPTRDGSAPRADPGSAAEAPSPPPDAGAAWLAAHGLLARGIHPHLPPAASEALAGEVRRNLAHNLHLIAAFGRVVDVLEEADVPVCPLKGIELLGTVYAEEPEARVLADLDLLVPEADAGRAAESLADRLGLAETAATRAARGLVHERCLVGPRLTVDLHAHLGLRYHRPRPGEPLATGFAALAPRPATLHGRTVHRLAPEVTLVHLVAHLVKHGAGSRLGWVEDVVRWAEAMDGDGSPPASILAAARRLGARRTLLAGLAAVRRRVGPELLPELAPRGADAAAAALHRLLADRDAPFGEPRAPGPLPRLAALVALADSPGDAWDHLAARVSELRTRRR